ncbi:hypothetical protein BD410DRAFT_866586 [Rickenella mellea]|uniref:Uncharacterized protein n=1 Tax=Rickenella mellea TaxID=50990 RepID=A0A4Y7PFY8_9AGAM|nr:hypothetical protein BD410DRAFT_866586 [Rickenella mellea]
MPCTFASIDAEIKAIEKAIKVFHRHKDDAAVLRKKESIVFLKKRRNRLAPVSRLPPELLSEIFEHMEQHIHGDRRWHHYALLPYPSRRWKNGIHICSDWRTIALDTPHLWSVVASTYSEEKLRFYLHYSKRHQLRVLLDEPYCCEHVVTLLQQFLHISELAIYGSEELWEAILPFLSLNFPVLSVASLKLSDGRRKIFMSESVVWNLLQSLKGLCLRGMSGIQWTSLHLNSLLTLEIDDFNVAHFYPIIDACPHLQQILFCSYLSIPPEYSTLSRQVSMPSLRSLSLSLPGPFCEQVLKCLVLQDDISLHLSCIIDNRGSTIPCQLFSILPEEIELYISISLDNYYDPPKSAVFFTASSSSFRSVSMKVKWDSPNRNIEEARFIAVTLTEPIIDRAISFKFSGSCGTRSQIWDDFLIRMPKLQTLHVECWPDYNYDDPAYIRCLVDVLTSGIFPSLRILYWEQFKSGGMLKGKSRLRKKLKQMIRHRADAGNPLDGVIVEVGFCPIFQYYSTPDINSPEGSLRQKLSRVGEVAFQAPIKNLDYVTTSISLHIVNDSEQSCMMLQTACIPTMTITTLAVNWTLHPDHQRRNVIQVNDDAADLPAIKSPPVAVTFRFIVDSEVLSILLQTYGLFACVSESDKYPSKAHSLLASNMASEGIRVIRPL